MKVDRTRFLLLTTALSAATAIGAVATGCTVKSTEAPTVNPVTEDSGGGDGGYDAYTDGGGDASACYDNTGAAASCAAANTSCTAACERYLTNYTAGVARGITECIIKLPTCEGADTEIAGCVQTALANACDDPTATTFCSPIVESCTADGGGTSGIDLTECTDLAKGLSTAGRAAFTSCVTEGTAGYCKADPSTCIDTIE
jgi:hypothetical protein